MTENVVRSGTGYYNTHGEHNNSGETEELCEVVGQAIDPNESQDRSGSHDVYMLISHPRVGEITGGKSCTGGSSGNNNLMFPRTVYVMRPEVFSEDFKVEKTFIQGIVEEHRLIID